MCNDKKKLNTHTHTHTHTHAHTHTQIYIYISINKKINKYIYIYNNYFICLFIWKCHDVILYITCWKCNSMFIIFQFFTNLLRKKDSLVFFWIEEKSVYRKGQLSTSNKWNHLKVQPLGQVLTCYVRHTGLSPLFKLFQLLISLAKFAA